MIHSYTIYRLAIHDFPTTMNRKLSQPETPESRSLSAPASTQGEILEDAIPIQDQGNGDLLSALERFPPMTARDELSNTRLMKGKQHSIEFLGGSDPSSRSAFGPVQQQRLNDPASPRSEPSVQFQELQALPLVEVPSIKEHTGNGPSLTLAAIDSSDQHLPVAQRQLSEISQGPHLTASPSRHVTPLASIQEPISGETRPVEANIGVACPEDRSTLHEKYHPHGALLDNSFSDDENEHSSLFKNNNTATLTNLSGETSRSQSTRLQDGIPIITDRPTPVSMPMTPKKTTLSAPGLQQVYLAGRAELQSYVGPNGSVAHFSECYELDPCPLSPGEARSPIRGTVRKRQAMDDFPDKMRTHYRRQWDELCAKPRTERGTIDAYESGDSELDFSEWEDAKERRRKKRKL